MHPGIYSGCKYTRATSDACSVKRRDRARIKNTSGFYDSTRLMRASNWNSARATTDDVSRAHEHAQVRELRNGQCCKTRVRPGRQEPIRRGVRESATWYLSIPVFFRDQIVGKRNRTRGNNRMHEIKCKKPTDK